MILPENLKPGERVYIYGFRDLTMGERTGGTYMRRGRFIRPKAQKTVRYISMPRRFWPSAIIWRNDRTTTRICFQKRSMRGT